MLIDLLAIDFYDPNRIALVGHLLNLLNLLTWGVDRFTRDLCLWLYSWLNFMIYFAIDENADDSSHADDTMRVKSRSTNEPRCLWSRSRLMMIDSLVMMLIALPDDADCWWHTCVRSRSSDGVRWWSIHSRLMLLILLAWKHNHSQGCWWSHSHYKWIT
jgi:hypothetical protein